MRPLIDIIGKRFGRLLVLSLNRRGRENGRSYSFWNCLCDCGKTITTNRANLTSGDTVSCGCYAREVRKSMHKTHGKCYTVLYSRWAQIKRRCYDKKCKAYKNYGGRGIKMQDNWKNDFEQFYKDLFPIFILGYTIERVDNDGHYELSNITFIPLVEQAKNRRTAVILTINGVSKSVTEWCSELKVDHKLVFGRKKRGWSDHDALFAVKRTNQHG